MILTSAQVEARRQILRESVLENVRWQREREISSSPGSVLGTPIRTRYDTENIPPPRRAPEGIRKLLKEDADKWDDYRDPYAATIRASITDKTIPVVKASVVLSGLDAAADDPIEKLESAKMLWGTGAQQTIVTEELLSHSFRAYLQRSQHDPYRSADLSRVQIDAKICFTNIPTDIWATALVVPMRRMPNQFIGILFGQRQCIDHLSYHSLPRSILVAKGQVVEEDVWGDLVLDEYVNLEGDLEAF